MERSIRVEHNPLAIGTPDRALIQPQAERETRRCIVCKLTNPDVLVAPVQILLVDGHPPTIWRESWVGEHLGRSDDARRSPASVKPHQLGLVRSFSRLYDQS